MSSRGLLDDRSMSSRIIRIAMVISGHFAPRPKIKMAAKRADEMFKLLIIQLPILDN